MAAQRERRVAVITGASSGIGWETARELARHGYAVTLMARRADRLEALAREIEAAGGDALVVPGDVTRQEDRERLIAETLGRFGRLDVLVNNAGKGRVSGTEADTPEVAADLFALNVLAPIEITRLALPALRAQDGTIVNVASMAAMVSMPPFGLYSATKFALAGWTEALRRELAPAGISVILINPGPVKTEFGAVAGMNVEEMQGGGISARRVAQAIVRAIARRQRVVVIPGSLAPAAWLGKTFPGLLDGALKLVMRYRPDIFASFGVPLPDEGRAQTQMPTRPASASATVDGAASA